MVFDLEHRPSQIQRLNAQAREFYQGLRELADKDPEFTQKAKTLRFHHPVCLHSGNRPGNQAKGNVSVNSVPALLVVKPTRPLR